MTYADSGAPAALVTGASGGIGREFAAVLAADGHDLVLVARGEDALRRLADDLSGRYGSAVTVVVTDLSDRASTAEVRDALDERGIEVDVLVNNAGFATYGEFVDLDLDRETDELEVNVVALTRLTKLFLPGMVDRGAGGVINVASTAAFQPGPGMAVYYASKAYVLSLSEALAEECRGTGVTVTALCPGPTETGFQSRAEMEESRLLDAGLADARAVAEAGYRGFRAGRAVVVPGAANRLGTLLPRVLPRAAVRRLVNYVQRPR
jgi:hypothetical protein